MNNQIRTRGELLTTLATALLERDIDTIEQLGEVVEQWMLNEEEREGLECIVAAAAQVCEF